MITSIDTLFESPISFKRAQDIIDRFEGLDSFFVRDKIIQKYSFAIPCTEALNTISTLSPILEIGAGNGHWARLLINQGINDIIAVDNYSTRYRSFKHKSDDIVLKMEGIKSMDNFPDRNILLCWPDYDNNLAFNVASKLKSGFNLIYIGEDKGGCNADDQFFDLLNREFIKIKCIRIPQWFGIHDYLSVYKKGSL